MHLSESNATRTFFEAEEPDFVVLAALLRKAHEEELVAA